MIIRPANLNDRSTIWQIMRPIIRAGETYTLERDMSETEALGYWIAPDKETFVAEEDGVVLGTYYIRANQTGGGQHVCNCGYMTDTKANGRGVGRQMHAHSINHAREKGFRAMQFNFVISSNERAVRLWLASGFEIVGRLPEAFRHPAQGYVDALVLFRTL